jgi:hypothetical protein
MTDEACVWTILVVFVCGAALLGALMPRIGTAWIAGVTYPLAVSLTVVGYDTIRDEQLDLDALAILGSISLVSLVIGLPITLLAHCARRILSGYAKLRNADNSKTIRGAASVRGALPSGTGGAG